MKKFPFEEPTFLGERMRSLRLSAGYKQENVAKILNVSRSTYSYYETGITRPDPLVIGVLAKFYQVPVSCFYQEVLDTKKKTPKLDPATVGILEQEERSLILFLRGNRYISTRQVIEMLEQQIKKIEDEGNDDRGRGCNEERHD